MDQAYYNLKRKLEELGYHNILPVEAVPLVECILADLLQTTRSLQHYMDLSKEALMQRDSLMLEAEPYRCDNAKLIQENNRLHRQIIQSKEEYLKFNKESKRKMKSLSEDLIKKESTITKLQHEIRDLSLRGLCAGTQSSRNKSRRKDAGDDVLSRVCICNNKNVPNIDHDLINMTKNVQTLEEKNEALNDEITLLKSQVEHRDNEIIRLNILLEGGRPLNAVSRDCCNINLDDKVQELLNRISEMESTNNILKKEVDKGLEKQHEAMLRALSLADKNKALQEELKKVDALALKVEDDCNKRLGTMMNEVNFLQSRIEELSLKNSKLERHLANQYSQDSPSKMQKIQETLNIALKEKDVLQKEIKDLLELNKNLQEKIMSLSQIYNKYGTNNGSPDSGQYKEKGKDSKKCPTKDELQTLFEDERKKYEKYMADIQKKLTETMNLFNSHLLKCKDQNISPKTQTSQENTFIRNLHKTLCETEQKLLMLKKENDELKSKIYSFDEQSKQNYKDVINQLNVENSELSKENIALSQQLSHYRNLNSAKYTETQDFCKKDIERLKDEVGTLTNEIHLLRKDKHEYNLRYKEAMDLVDKLKRDLTYKQRQFEKLEEENCSYKMTNRTGKASVDHLRDECHFLREQIKKMQNDVIKEKTLASQIKNIQMETERSSNEIQEELLCTQKKLSLSKDNIDALERKCKDLQSEIMSLKNDKVNLLDNFRKVDQERDKLVIELDHKTENICNLEQKIKSQTYEIKKLENDLVELRRKLNINTVSEHKLIDYEAQIKYLNSEILRLTQQFDNAIIENKHLQNSLADASGNLKIVKIEYEKSRKEVDGLKQQLQHYVAEIRRIEELLSQKETERSDMLEQFASLSVEANILENTNHSLENESATKSIQLQSYINKIQDLETKLLDKDSVIDTQSSRIANMTCKISALENEVKLLTEEKLILEQNVSYLKRMCNNLQTEHESVSRGLDNTDSELKLYENKIKSLSSMKTKLETEKQELTENLKTTDKLLSNARKEIVELKLALQDATSETKSLQEHVNRLNRTERDADIHESSFTRNELELPLLLEETIHEVSQEEDEDSSRYHEVHKKFSKYSGTL